VKKLKERFNISGQMNLLPRAASWLAVIASEFRKRDRQIEQDNETTKVTLELIIGRRRDVVKIRYLTTAESSLVDNPIR